MITSNERRLKRPGPGDVVVTDWQSSGLLMPSVVRTRRLWTAEERDFEGRLLGNLDAATLGEVKRIVRSLIA